jgi:hypothetical protein
VGVIDGDVEPADPSQRTASDHDVVEREVPARGLGRCTASKDSAFDGHPLVDSIVAFGNQGEHALKVVRLGLREKPDFAQVDTQEGHVDFRDCSRGPKEGAIPAQHDQQVRRLELAQ